MTTKTLIITPQGTAKEINPLIKPKEWKVSPTTQDFIERKEYKQMEDSLKEYKIIGKRLSETTVMLADHFAIKGAIQNFIGTTHELEVNEEDKTAIIL